MDGSNPQRFEDSLGSGIGGPDILIYLGRPSLNTEAEGQLGCEGIVDGLPTTISVDLSLLSTVGSNGLPELGESTECAAAVDSSLRCFQTGGNGAVTTSGRLVLAAAMIVIWPPVKQ